MDFTFTMNFLILKSTEGCCATLSKNFFLNSLFPKQPTTSKISTSFFSKLPFWTYGCIFSVPAFNFPHPDKCLWHSGAFSLVARRSNKQSKKKTRWGWKSSIFPMRNTSRNCGFSMAMLDLFKRIQSKNSKSISWRLMNFESLIELFNLMKFYLTSFGTTFSFNSNSIPEYTLDCPPSQYKWQMKV